MSSSSDSVALHLQELSQLSHLSQSLPNKNNDLTVFAHGEVIDERVSPVIETDASLRAPAVIGKEIAITLYNNNLTPFDLGRFAALEIPVDLLNAAGVKRLTSQQSQD